LSIAPDPPPLRRVIDQIGTLEPCAVTVEHVEGECAGAASPHGARSSLVLTFSLVAALRSVAEALGHLTQAKKRHPARVARGSRPSINLAVTSQLRCAIANVRARCVCRFTGG